MINTSTNPAFIESQQYSNFILTTLKDGMLPGNLFRNVSDFGSGSVLDIKTIGEVTLQEVTEEESFTYNPIESGTVKMYITDYPGDAWYVTDEMRQDSTQLEALHAARGAESKRALQEHIETRYLETLNLGQTPSDDNAVIFSHRFRCAGTNQTMTEKDMIDARLAADKAHWATGGRVMIVDPVVSASLSKQSLLVNNLDAVGQGFSLAKDGFDKDHSFVTMLHGWQVWTSNRLPTIDGETLALFDGTASEATSGVVNIAMSIADDNAKPGMFAWRSLPKTETERDIDKRRDKFTMAARMGFGVQRKDTMICLISSATATI